MLNKLHSTIGIFVLLLYTFQTGAQIEKCETIFDGHDLSVQDDWTPENPFFKSFNRLTGIITTEFYRSSKVNTYSPLTLDVVRGSREKISPLVWNKIQNSLKALYRSFSSQGPERQILVEPAMKQDRLEVDRVVHFNLSHEQFSVGHAQVLISHGDAEELHYETQWKGSVPRAPGVNRGEIGRLFFFPHSDAPLETYVSANKWQLAIPAWTSVHYVRLLMFQKLLSWANHDANLDSLSVQINSPVRRVLEKMGMPLFVGIHHKVVQSFDSKSVTEHVYIFNKEAMKQAENILFQRILLMHFDQLDRTDPIYGDKLTLRFYRNEFPALFESGLFKDRVNSSSLQMNKQRIGFKRLTITEKSETDCYFEIPRNIEAFEGLDLEFSRNSIYAFLDIIRTRINYWNSLSPTPVITAAQSQEKPMEYFGTNGFDSELDVISSF
jgi:hypothetical protein